MVEESKVVMIDTSGNESVSEISVKDHSNKLDEELKELAGLDDSVYNLFDFSVYPEWKMTKENRLVYQIVLS